MTPFDFHPRTRIVFGADKIDSLGELAGELGARRVLLVSDPGIVAAGHTERGTAALRAAGIEVHLFSDIQENPTTAHVDAGFVIANRYEPELIVGLGGGSSMDCAKGINFLYTNGGQIADYWGKNKATQEMLPMIAVPTTAGTGSETQSFALISDAETHVKMACGDKKAACAVAILDPDLTMSMPVYVAAATGIDALSHALETYVTKSRNTISQLFSRQAWRMLCHSFPQMIRTPDDRPVRAAMQLGAHLAGAAIENSMLGAAHALANPLSAHFGVTHGTAIGVMLPHVIRYNAQPANVLYGHLANDAGLCDADDPRAVELLADFVTSLVSAAGSPTQLTELEIDADLIPTLAAEAAKQWTGTFNPRPVNEQSLQELYRCAFSKE